MAITPSRPLTEADDTDENGHYRRRTDSDYGNDNDDGDGPDDDDNADNTDRTDDAKTDDTGNYYTAELGEFEEPIRRYIALCYEDICLWIVQNPKQGERDLLAMEVHLRHHKGADSKPKCT